MGKRAREKRQRREDAAPEAAASGAAPAASRSRRPAAPAPDVLSHPPRRGDGPRPWTALLRAHQIPLLVLGAIALFVRLRLLHDISRTPYFQAGNIDSEAYQRWATTIAGGQWAPTGTFYQSPFYAYYLAIFYVLFGVGAQWGPRLVQVLLGSLSPLLVYGLGTRLFSTRVGWIAGGIVALYGPIVLEEITISKTTLLIVSALAGFTLYLRHGAWARAGGMFVAGLVFGVTVVGVGQWLPAFLALSVWAYFLPERASDDQRRRTAAAFFAGGVLAMAPMIVWNTAHGGGLILTSGDAGLNLYTGNNPRASGLPREPDGVRNTPQFEEADSRSVAEQKVGHALTPAGVSNYWSGQAVAWATSHPGDFVGVVASKLITLWNAYEISDNYHYAFMRAYFLPLLWLTATFAVVAPLALVGMAMPFWRRRDVTALYVATGVYLATVVLFYVRGRYRMPAVPFLAVFAAVAIERMIRAVTSQRWANAALLAGGLVVAGVFTNHEYCEAAHDGLPDICLGGDTWYDQEWLKVSEWYRNQGDVEAAVTYAERARECKSPRSAGFIAFWLGELETMWTQSLTRAGQRDVAQSHFQRAERFFQASQRAGFRRGPTAVDLGLLYTEIGDFPHAVDAFETAQSLGALDRSGSQKLGRAYAAVGRCGDAERLLTKVDGGTPTDDTRALLGSCTPR